MTTPPGMARPAGAVAALARYRLADAGRAREALRSLLDAMGLPTDLTDGLNVQG